MPTKLSDSDKRQLAKIIEDMPSGIEEKHQVCVMCDV
jgi:hypothetical protein